MQIIDDIDRKLNASCETNTIVYVRRCFGFVITCQSQITYFIPENSPRPIAALQIIYHVDDLYQSDIYTIHSY